MHEPCSGDLKLSKARIGLTVGWVVVSSNDSQTQQTKGPHKAAVYSPEKLCHNRICCPSNRSKQVQETHTAYISDTQYTRQSLNEKQHTWLHRQCHEWHVAEKVNRSTMVEVIAMQGGHYG